MHILMYILWCSKLDQQQQQPWTKSHIVKGITHRRRTALSNDDVFIRAWAAWPRHHSGGGRTGGGGAARGARGCHTVRVRGQLKTKQAKTSLQQFLGAGSVVGCVEPWYIVISRDNLMHIIHTLHDTAWDICDSNLQYTAILLQVQAPATAKYICWGIYYKSTHSVRQAYMSTLRGIRMPSHMGALNEMLSYKSALHGKVTKKTQIRKIMHKAAKQ